MTTAQEDAELLASCFQEDQSWGQNFYDYIEAINGRQPMAAGTYAYSLAVATFCGVHDLIPGFETKVNWFGFGELQVAFEAEDDGEPLKTLFWASDLAKVSGVDIKQLHDFWVKERDEGRSDIYALTYYRPDLDRDTTLPLFSHSAAMRVMTFLSPWSKEFYEATKELMAHAMVKSGLGEALFGSGSGFTAIAHMKGSEGEVIKLQMPIHSFREDDNVPIVRAPWDDATDDEMVPVTDLCETYEVQRTGDALDNFLGPRVSEEEATRLAFQGPAAGLTPDA